MSLRAFRSARTGGMAGVTAQQPVRMYTAFDRNTAIPHILRNHPPPAQNNAVILPVYFEAGAKGRKSSPQAAPISSDSGSWIYAPQYTGWKRYSGNGEKTHICANCKKIHC